MQGQSITYEFYVTDWGNNELFGGAWETWEKGVFYDSFFDAIQPEGKIHKAGSAHCLNFWGFTWGAIFNGMYHAEWVAERLANPGTALEDLEPYSPCFDLDEVTGAEMGAFYSSFGGLFEPGGVDNGFFARLWRFFWGLIRQWFGWLPFI